MLVGYWTADINSDNAEYMMNYKQYACDCYFVSQDPESFAIPGDVRFDVAHAIPECTDCATCDAVFHEANEAFNSVSQCPVDPNYKNKHGWFSLGGINHWRDVTGCNSKISIAAMIFWIKDYNVYSRWAWSIAAIYCGLLFISMMVILVFYYKKQMKIRDFLRSNDQNRIAQQNKGFMNKMDYVMKIVYLYNILVSVVLLYLFYKPAQYYQQDLYVGDNNKHIICEVNSMPMHQEDILGVCAFMTFMACCMQLLYTFIYTCKCCKKCINVGCCVCCDVNLGNCCKCDTENKACKCCYYQCSKYGAYGRKRSMSDGTAELIHKFGNKSPKFLCCPHQQCSKYIKCRSLFALLMVVFLVFTLVAFGWLYKGVAVNHKYKTQAIFTLILLPLSFFDNPWTWKAIIEICGRYLTKWGWKHNVSANIFDEESDIFSDDGRY